jgi:hypothetical protein
MRNRWTKEEDKRIARQLKNGVVIGGVRVTGRKKGDIQKRAYRIGLLVKHQSTIQRNTAQWATVKTALESGGKTIKQLSTEPGLTDDIVRRVIEQHRAELHVLDWSVESTKGRRRTKLWKLGAAEEVVDDGGSEATADDPEVAMVAEARRRLREVEERGELIRRDPFVTALFGQYQPGNRLHGSVC